MSILPLIFFIVCFIFCIYFMAMEVYQKDMTDVEDEFPQNWVDCVVLGAFVTICIILMAEMVKAVS